MLSGDEIRWLQIWISVPKSLIRGVALAKSDPTYSFSYMLCHLLESPFLR